MQSAMTYFTRALACQHLQHPGVAKVACKALFTLTTNDDNSDADIANGGGGKIVIQAMRAHKASPDIQELGCRGKVRLLLCCWCQRGAALRKIRLDSIGYVLHPMMMMTFITQGGEGRGKTNKKRKATKSKGRGLEEGASHARIFG